MTDLPGEAPDQTIRYADYPDAVIDVHRGRGPNRGPVRGTVFLVHGGFWKVAYDRVHTRAMARALAEAGFTVFTPEYRRVPEVRWPVPGTDLLDALTHVGPLIEQPLHLIGHSAGGHLALWLGHQAARLSTAAPVQVVALAPVADLDTAIRLRLGDDATLGLFGGTPSPQQLAEADPIRFLDEHDRVTVVHPVDDDLVPIELSHRLAQRHLGVVVREVTGGHFAPITPGSAGWQQVLAALE